MSGKCFLFSLSLSLSSPSPSPSLPPFPPHFPFSHCAHGSLFISLEVASTWCIISPTILSRGESCISSHWSSWWLGSFLISRLCSLISSLGPQVAMGLPQALVSQLFSSLALSQVRKPPFITVIRSRSPHMSGALFSPPDSGTGDKLAPASRKAALWAHSSVVLHSFLIHRADYSVFEPNSALVVFYVSIFALCLQQRGVSKWELTELVLNASQSFRL